ncbi:hypothetical protein OHB26_21020 [Nocardia sp. NBC_01503]|uniref:hypothetical protein n=1 Tax=Nocardia sp. NBC_01503 TaxID=2975997 RepID=UPI002E7ABF6D|nr:hypothetical protein [Nocardia sp. NBC_01503]WTL29482.1 hypothetical protein OHB26_21020 [Nocardia sp. NBC_01503]
MAYLSTTARTAINGDRTGGRGSLDSHWHRMPDATVELLAAWDCRGDIEIRWKVNTNDGVLADLTVQEARVLRENLTAAITAFESSDNDVADPEIVTDDDSEPMPEEVA